MDRAGRDLFAAAQTLRDLCGPPGGAKAAPQPRQSKPQGRRRRFCGHMHRDKVSANNLATVEM